MKLLKDLVVTRKEFQDWERNLAWARDGTLFITAYPEVCIGQPIYRKEVSNNSKNLFHIKEYPLSYENKFEFDNASLNPLLNSQPVSFARLCKPSPVDPLLAILTSNLNVQVFENQRLLLNLDEPGNGVQKRSYHCLEWSPDGDYIAVGNENSEVVIFTIVRGSNGDTQFEHKISFRLGNEPLDAWVINVSWRGDTIVAVLDNNSIYQIKLDQDIPVKLKSSSKFKIVDCCFSGVSFLVTDSSDFYRFDLTTHEASSLSLGPGNEFRIVPLGKEANEVILMSNKTSCKINLKGELSLSADDILAHHLERKFKRWSVINNEFNKYETTLLIRGICTSPDGYTVAIVYNLERVSMKYKIASEHQAYVTFIPLCDSWTISRDATGLAWYQTYQIYQCMLPSMTHENSMTDSTQTPLNVDIPLKEYIKSFLNNNEMNSLRFFNFVEDNPSIRPFRRAIFDYAVANRSQITNPIDMASVQSLASILGCPSPVEAKTVEFKSEFISESFDFGKNHGDEVIISEQQHPWKRCAVSLLPILTTKVKVCHISNQRIIDLSRDSHNEYGWFTRTLLEALSDESLYSGTIMTAV